MMNRGVLQSSPVQQMMAAGNPSWWNINNLMRPPPMLPPHHHHNNHHQTPPPPPPSSSSTTNLMAPPPNINNNSSNNSNDDDDNSNNLFHGHYNNINIPTPSSSSWLDDHTNHQHLHESWSQLLMGGLCMGEEDQDQDQVVVLHQQHTGVHVDVKKESSVESYSNSVNNVYSCNQEHEFHQQLAAAANWSSSHPPQMNNIPASSPQSCVTTTTFSNGNCCNSMLDFSSKSSDRTLHARHPAPDRSSECNSIGNGGALKKPKVQSSSTQSTFKVRKEKLGDRITALHQLVSPFGKTDTASVLLEAIGYIRFLQSQIEALSLPYLSGGAGNKRQPHVVQGERNCIFPEDPGQLLNDNCLKRKGGPDQDLYEEPKKDLRSRGLCLVPVSCTLHVGSDNGADYWAPALGGGFR